MFLDKVVFNEDVFGFDVEYFFFCFVGFGVVFVDVVFEVVFDVLNNGSVWVEVEYCDEFIFYCFFVWGRFVFMKDVEVYFFFF